MLKKEVQSEPFDKPELNACKYETMEKRIVLFFPQNFELLKIIYSTDKIHQVNQL